VTKDLSGWRYRLATAEARASELAERRQAAETELGDAIEVPKALAIRRTDLAEGLRTAESRKAAAEDARSQAESVLQRAIKDEKDAERSASDAREARAASNARAEAAQAAVVEARQRMLDETGHLPAELLAQLNTNAEDLPDANDLDTDVQRLKRQRDALGAVNLRAEEDARDIQVEHDTLRIEKLDLEEAVKTLRAGIASLNREGRERLLTAFEQVNSNFGMLFTHLFGGGEANLVMVESDDPLDAGLEIMCQPPGKKLSTLSLLSGGEQTLTALALIFAVFLANPAPICVLDEVDAPLDDANVSRFCDMLDEMCRRTNTRFLIITHHAVTMARMDRLFGVTMQEQGVSQLVSVDLKRAERMVA
jgi:chromosome segregation protein